MRLSKKNDFRHLLVQKNVPGKGRGLFAKVDIPQGTRLLAEQGLLSLSEDVNITMPDVVRAFELLSPGQRKAYLKLHPNINNVLKRLAALEMKKKWTDISELYQKVIAIWMANNFGNVYSLGCLINHSCEPNVDYVWNARIGKQTFHAIRDIRAGEELSKSYTQSTYRRRAHRKLELSQWGFVCCCAACEDTPQGRQKEEKRAELFELDQFLARLNNSKCDDKESLRQGLKAAQRMMKLQIAEGLVHRELGNCYRDAAKYSARLGNVKQALMYAQKELEVEEYCIGTDHHDYQKQLDVVLQLRHAAKRPKLFDFSSICWHDTKG